MRLIVNADDFGFTVGVNRGILECATAGIVTSASVMVNTPGFDDAIARARTEAPTLGLGLHLNLIVGAPVSRVPSLTNPTTGRFWPFRVLLWRASRGLILVDDVARETDAQLGRLRTAGVTITHVDSHRHVHVHHALWPAVVDAAARAAIHVVRVPRESLFTHSANWPATVTKALLGATRLTRRSVDRRPHVRTPDHFTGISLQGVRDFRGDLLRTIDALRPGVTELAVHPGYVDDDLRAQDGFLAPREAEVRGLTDPMVRERIAGRGIVLVRFAGL